MGNDATTDTLKQAGKVIAVHINYPSRAAERGRTPEQPSYFLKPSSSLALTGGAVERPAGCELLGFEGEIALVIGKTARRVTVEDAWSYVGGVTASNDLGVYDLRWADKGSNLRSKGGDGFTPVGPAILNAADVDPAALRVRTWVNGELAQDDTTADLLFPFAQLVADLSQLLTLEPGDLILTGTPAGASVAVPGDRLEVEVDVPGTDKTTGRLATTVTDGITPLASFGAQPRIDDKQREEAWGSAEKAGLAPHATEDQQKTLTPELKARLESVATATLSSQMRARGLNNVSIDGLTGTRPGRKVVGTARTLRFVPDREDLFKSHGGGYNAQKRAIDSVGEGEILVMEARGEKGTGTLGDILALRAKHNGAAAIITDGGVRDYSTVAGIDLPVYCANPHPAVLGRKHVPWDTDLTIACGGATVQPGDIIVADDDGILVIPPAMAEELVEACLKQEHQEEFIAEMVRAGHGVDGLYPMNAAWKEKYEAWAAEQA
ncbi:MULTISPECIES: fumarylacetoacetate hydrolase family protein [unclassified Arthrobacter]|uniref:fumarylacetoacetate hydrolase family protein n=1 Tax=unclassified Arthrobacter TaxID=235627 RepID=UPI001E3A082E|nr:MULTISPECIES: fumarylacetoacetate hydrolase family protein [unclassified Arthrobacter]MCC9144506.1 fumarylacetoacetate hydrolase family protein [Arthrobacter sp. zg-Y919]MDK1275732.1 fumarylacetoacetate hydrolase family protein [Arthrobacter sp. zg.Y919]WIB02901.1 fumarylacetoacetate hydrolase family protein [Arthrobacter sp. zg-Y919]